MNVPKAFIVAATSIGVADGSYRLANTATGPASTTAASTTVAARSSVSTPTPTVTHF
jgi:hypothetical protein